VLYKLFPAEVNVNVLRSSLLKTKLFLVNNISTSIKTWPHTRENHTKFGECFRQLWPATRSLDKTHNK